MKDLSPQLRAVHSVLGTPYCQGEGYAISCGDCLELMPGLPAGVFQLTVTSPPYNIGKEYEKQLPFDEYAAWCERWFAEVHRLTSPQGAFWLNLGYVELPDRARAIPLPYLLWQRCPFYLLQEIV